MMKRLEACGVILAGGESRRMGMNKSLLPIHGLPLIAHLTNQLTAWFEQVVIVTNTPDEFRFLGLPMSSDRIPGLGPLGGLEAGLLASRYDYAFFCATDMPFLNEGLVRHMVGLTPGHDVVVPRIGAEYEPMHAVYARNCLPFIHVHLDAQRLRLTSFFESVHLRAVTESEVRLFGDPQRLFFNCNTPEDWEQALRMARST